MPTPMSYSARIQRLEAAKLRINELPQDGKLSSKPMAEALSVSWPTLREWCDLEEFYGTGAFVRGGNGIEWEFDPHKTVEVLLSHFRSLVASDAERNAPSLKAQGIESPSTSLVEAGRLMHLTNAAEEARRRAGLTYDAAPVTSAFDRIAALNNRVHGGSLASRVDPTGQLDPILRRRIDQVGEEAQWEFAAGLEEISEELREGTNAG